MCPWGGGEDTSREVGRTRPVGQGGHILGVAGRTRPGGQGGHVLGGQGGHVGWGGEQQLLDHCTVSP